MINIRMLPKKGLKRGFLNKNLKLYNSLFSQGKKKDENQRHRWSFFSIGKVLPNECLIYMPMERAVVFKGRESRGLYYDGAGRRGSGFCGSLPARQRLTRPRLN